jgi:hypothetical protein
MRAQENRPAATNCETAESSSAGGHELALSVSQPLSTTSSVLSVTRFVSRRVRARRRIVRELDELLGIFNRPDPRLIYAAAPSREAALDD